MTSRNSCKFSSNFDELIGDQGEMVLTLEHNSIDNSIAILSSSRLGEEFSTVGKSISE